jgi:DNA-binding response OmpR family regulator
MASRLILIIDDNQDIRDFISMALADEGYTFIAPAEDITLEWIARRQPTLILADSYALTRQVPALTKAYREALDSRPVLIVLTTSPQPILVREHTQADDFLSKPFSLNELFLIIECFVEKD